MCKGLGHVPRLFGSFLMPACSGTLGNVGCHAGHSGSSLGSPLQTPPWKMLCTTADTPVSEHPSWTGPEKEPVSPFMEAVWCREAEGFRGV